MKPVMVAVEPDDTVRAALGDVLHRRYGGDYGIVVVDTEHLLLGLVATEAGLAGQVLRRMGVELRTTRRAVVTTLAGSSIPASSR